LQQVGSIHDVLLVWLLKPYISDRSSALELPQPIEINNEEKYELKENCQSSYQYIVLCYRVKYKGYSAEERE
jgi:hypothetical protein